MVHSHLFHNSSMGVQKTLSKTRIGVKEGVFLC